MKRINEKRSKALNGKFVCPFAGVDLILVMFNKFTIITGFKVLMSYLRLLTLYAPLMRHDETFHQYSL